jgi:hypothetical protein
LGRVLEVEAIQVVVDPYSQLKRDIVMPVDDRRFGQ